MATIPMIAPTGEVADVPQEQVATAVKQGAKIGFDMISPDGNQRAVVPADQVHNAIVQGAQLDPASAARFAGASVPRPDAIRADEAAQPHYADEIGSNNQPGGTPGEAESANDASILDLGKGAAKAAVSDALAAGQALTPNFMVSKKNRQTAENIQAKLQPQNEDEQVGATTERAATTAAGAGLAVAGVPELLENIAGLIRGAKSGVDVASLAANGPSKVEAGQAALDAAARVKQEAGAAVGAAKEAAIPPDFKMTINPDGPLFKTLGEIDDSIGPKAGGLDSLKDPSLDVVRNVSEELASKGELDQKDVDAIRQQLSSQIQRADAAAKSGTATGDPARYLKQIKSALDEEYYQKLSAATNLESATNLQNASKDYAGVVKNQTRGPAKAIFKAPTPEKAISRLTNADATTVGSFIKGMSADDVSDVQVGVLKNLADSARDADGNVNWPSLNDKFANRREAMQVLFGNKYDDIAQSVQKLSDAQKPGRLAVAGRKYGPAVIRGVLEGSGIGLASYAILKKALGGN